MKLGEASAEFGVTEAGAGFGAESQFAEYSASSTAGGAGFGLAEVGAGFGAESQFAEYSASIAGGSTVKKYFTSPGGHILII